MNKDFGAHLSTGPLTKGVKIHHLRGRMGKKEILLRVPVFPWAFLIYMYT